MEANINNLIGTFTFAISVISIVLILVGVLITLYNLGIKIFFTKGDYYAETRLQFSRFLLLALEFQIAADILETVLKPDWEEFAKLAATIAIRSVLSYILILETKSQT